MPYGHPDTLCPSGRVWQAKNETGEWDIWSNNPWQLEFHDAGKNHTQRMLECANRVGKTYSASPEVTFHMTGLYPDWWTGRRFTKPVLVWTGSPTNETSRDIVQKSLIGGTGEDLGTGYIPRELFIGKPNMRQAGVSNVVDQFKVRHVSGGVSQCILKTYEQGWRKWQGTQPDVIWLDEEPDQSSDQKPIFSEALTRLLTSHGIMMVTFTPLLGQTDLVIHFEKGGKGIWLGHATWDDAPHLNHILKEELIASYPEWQRDARTKGIPMMGEGRIFTADEEDIICEPFKIPPHFARICGIDFGLDHPAAGAWIAWDRDTDTIYLYDCYKKSGQQPLYHAEAIKRRGNLPVSWPHDGADREKGSGKQLKDIYKAHGVNMLGRSACYKNDKLGAQPQWPVIEDIIEREHTGRFKVFSNCTDYITERRTYHTKDGKIVDRGDDTLKATFYAIMMKRYGVSQNMSSSTPKLTSIIKM